MEENMTNTNVAATNPSLLRAWWMNKNLRFNIAIGSIIMILNIKAIFYTRTHKIPVDIDHAPLLPAFACFYILGDLFSCLFWVSAISEVNVCQGAYVCGLTGHITGFIVFIHLLSFISPQSALYVGMIFGLFMLRFVAVMMGPCLWSCVQEVQDWWELVNQPGGNPISNSAIESLEVCNIAATTTNPSLIRVWWMNKNLRFDVVMSSIIMILNIGAIVRMRTHKVVPFDIDDSGIVVFVLFYILFGLFSCIFWVLGVTDVSVCVGAYVLGGISHIFGLSVFVNLLYYISPQWAMYVGKFLGLCLLSFVAVMSAPCLRTRVQELRVWWKFVNQPGTVIQ